MRHFCLYASEDFLTTKLCSKADAVTDADRAQCHAARASATEAAPCSPFAGDVTLLEACIDNCAGDACHAVLFSAMADRALFIIHDSANFSFLGVGTPPRESGVRPFLTTATDDFALTLLSAENARLRLNNGDCATRVATFRMGNRGSALATTAEPSMRF